jgi:hypothetical protein
VQPERIVIVLTSAKGSTRKPSRIEVPWRKTPPTRRREILLPASSTSQVTRPIRSENRALLVASIARGRRWLDELVSASTENVESIAPREGCSVRKVNMTVSLAFLAPDLVKAAFRMAWVLPGSANCLPNGPASAACSAFPSLNPTDIRTESLPAQSPFPRKRNFRARDGAAENRLLSVQRSPRRRKPRDKARQPRAFGVVSGKLRLRQSVWWARQDSNLQPDRYERTTVARTMPKNSHTRNDVVNEFR